MTAPDALLVRGTCACGQRYRIRNASIGVSVLCPTCRRAITIADADLRAAWADARLRPIQEVDPSPLEAIPLDYGELRIAARGSKPGLTGDEAYDHQEALMMRAMRGWSSLVGSDDNEVALDGRAPLSERLAAPQRTRKFAADVLASLYFAGNARNAIIVLCSAIAACGFLALLLLPTTVVPAAQNVAHIIGGVSLGMILAYKLQFWNALLILTAEGREDVPWLGGWSFVHEWLRPTFRVIIVTAVCLSPEWAIDNFAPIDAPWRRVALGAAIVLGAWLWPMAMMSTTVGESLSYLRPDRLLRSIIAVGGSYWLAALIALIVNLAWHGAVIGVSELPRLTMVFVFLAPFGIVLASLYFGYVLFRTVGLLYRHFYRRMPWRI